jgi:P27 family predicted phage terminase small subunit
MRGRKPLPSHLKLVQGNRGKRQIRPESIKVEPSLPMPPPHLCDEAKVEWGRVASMLYALRLLSEADIAALAAYCQAWATFKRATEALEVMSKGDPLTKGLLIKTTNGNAIQNPLLGIANKAAADMVRFAAEFGMTPSARARINAPKGEETQSQDTVERFFSA